MATSVAERILDDVIPERELILAVLEQHAREQPSRTAISRRRLDGSFEETTYRALLGWTLSYARLVREQAFESPIVPLCFGRTAQAVAAMLGVLVSGRAFCNVNTKLRLPQVEHVLGSTKASFALADATGVAMFRDGIPRESLTAKTHWIVVLDDTFCEPAQRRVNELERTTSIELFEPADSSKASGRASGRALALAARDSVGACLFTSGSTGVPKGVLVGAADLVARARAELHWYSVNRADVLLNLLPFSFDVGLNQLLCSVLAGAELVLLDSWLPLDIRRVIGERRVTGVSGVPSIWSDFLRCNLALDRSGPHGTLRYLTISGGDLPPAQHALMERFANGAGIFKTYGQTEAFRATCLRPHEYGERPLSVGRPYSGVNVYVVREDGALANPGEIGEVVHSGLGVMLGYLDQEDSDGKLRDNPFYGAGDEHPRAIFTGDYGMLDEAGYLFLRGRRDELVKRNGNRVYPSEVKNQLAAVPGVAQAEVVVTRVGDEDRLAGFVVPEEGAALDSGKLRRELVARLPAFMIPDFFGVEPELPRTASGKPDRPKLAAVAARELTRPKEPAVPRRLSSVIGASRELDRVLSEIARTHETPCFVYFMEVTEARVAAIRRAFGGSFGVSFAMKCNPHPAILNRLVHWVDALDVSSRGELELALGAGWPARTISFTGPAKQARDLEAAVRHRIGEVVLESLREAELLARAASDAGVRQPVLVRIAPAHVPKGFGVNMAGRPCQFGIDEEDVDAVLPRILALPGIDVVGLHMYSGTQCLKPEAIAENYGIFLGISRRLCERHGLVPKKLVFGSGIGIPYHDADTPVDLDEVAHTIRPALLDFKASPRFAETALLLETGRYLVGEAGVYLSRVVSRKRSRGSEIGVLDGGMNHHLGAAGHLGMVLHRNYRMIKVYSERPDGPEASFDLYGPLCTTIDVLGRGVKMRGLEVGDVVGVCSSGAYALTASPVHFISHPLPKELMVITESGRSRIVELERVKA